MLQDFFLHFPKIVEWSMINFQSILWRAHCLWRWWGKRIKFMLILVLMLMLNDKIPICWYFAQANGGIEQAVLDAYCWMYSTWNIPQVQTPHTSGCPPPLREAILCQIRCGFFDINVKKCVNVCRDKIWHKLRCHSIRHQTPKKSTTRLDFLDKFCFSK